ncbi:MAG: iron ABC transporter permease [Candidatus Sumerlaeia bacterium]|nr:iron ABC transporter permease [Candidatus Sumerlaeia bacterium]
MEPAPPKPDRRARLWIPALALGVIACAAVLPLFGQVRLDPVALARALRSGEDSIEAHLYLTTRLPRVLFGLVCGGGLALAGAVYQAVLRNDLAEPYSLGVASGSALGALAVYQLAGLRWSAWALPSGAFMGAVGALALLYGLSRVRRGPSTPGALLLAGVTLNFLFGSAILLIQYLSDPFQTLLLLRWLMGGLDVPSYGVVGAAAALLAGALAVLLAQARALNLLALGDEGAFHLGVRVVRVRLLALGAASVLVAFLAAFAGPIGFVGLIVPHAMRKLVGADHRSLLISATMGGAIFLAMADMCARFTLGSVELPVGVLTGLLGAPFFLWLLATRRSP